jgi:hypothetical protein
MKDESMHEAALHRKGRTWNAKVKVEVERQEAERDRNTPHTCTVSQNSRAQMAGLEETACGVPGVWRRCTRLGFSQQPLAGEAVGGVRAWCMVQQKTSHSFTALLSHSFGPKQREHSFGHCFSN